MHCKDCVFRVDGNCRNANLTDEDYNPDFDKTVGLKYSYDEGGWFEVGEYFGCIHFKDKNAILKDNPSYQFLG